jgi:hypothetical protein
MTVHQFGDDEDERGEDDVCIDEPADRAAVLWRGRIVGGEWC